MAFTGKHSVYCLFVACIIGIHSVKFSQCEFTYPEQIAIAAAAETYSSLVITWVTFDPTESSQVQYSVHDSSMNLSQTAVGEATKFVVKDSTTVRFIHRVTLTGLAPLTYYDYRCGFPGNWSEAMTMKTLGDETFSPTIAVYGDFGLKNAQSLPLLKEGVARNFDLVFHVGDFAYNMIDNDGKVGDAFMNQIQDIATQVPYMVVPGNHENQDNFTHYKHRFSMPGDTENLFYSWTVGPVRVLSFSTEFYFFLSYGTKMIEWQYEWLEAELKKANTPEERAKHPWILTAGHRPMYCTTIDDDDCDHYNSVVRVGEPVFRKYGLEKLFYDYGVDVELWAHEHIYERYWPLYDYKVYNGSLEQPYTDPKAPVHIVSGSAGCQEDHDKFQRKQPEWVASMSSDYGYTLLTVHNHTHLSVEQISADKDGAVVDQFTIVKHSHGPYN